MDLINSVTQNSNNRKTEMENQGGIGSGGGGGPNDGDDNNQNGTKQNSRQYETEQQQQQQQVVTSNNKPASSSSSSAQVPDYLRAIGMDPRKFWPRKYRFTREKSPGQHNPLSIAQRNFYESNGYIVLDDCISKRLLEQIRSTKNALLLNRQIETINNSATGLTNNNDDFIDEFLLDKLLVKNTRLTQYVKCFCDEKFMLMTNRLIEHFQQQEQRQYQQQIDYNNSNQIINTTKDFNETQDPHSIESQLMMMNNSQQNRQTLFRDWIYLPFRPIDKVCATIVALEPIEHTILVVPGTHRVGQCTISSTLDNITAAYDSSQEKANSSTVTREIYESSPNKLSTLVDKSRKGFKYINLKPGQTLFYHPGLVHGFSNDLINFRKRQLASLAYYASADCEFVDLRQTIMSFDQQQQQQQNNQLQMDLMQQQVPLSLAHFGDKNPRDYRSWLDKPKLVNESRANL